MPSERTGHGAHHASYYRYQHDDTQTDHVPEYLRVQAICALRDDVHDRPCLNEHLFDHMQGVEDTAASQAVPPHVPTAL